MAQVPGYTNTVTCPYNKSHNILRERFQTHIVKCAKSYPNIKLKICPFNTTHLMSEAALDEHVTSCPECVNFDMYRFPIAPATTTQANRPQPVFVALPEGENWDDKIVSTKFRQRIKSFYSHNPEFWMGFTDSHMIGAPHGSCLWTELDGVPFGEYWFQIKTIRFRNNEALIKLKILKPMHDVEESIRQEHKIKENQMSYDSGQMAKDFQELFEMWRKSCSDYFLWLFSQQITAKNIAGVLKFICLLALAAGTAGIQGLMYLGAFTLKFMAEFRKLLHVSMPILLKALDLLTKIIGGIFILLAMIWRDLIGKKNPPAYNAQLPMPSLGYKDEPPLRPIEYRADVRSNRSYGSINRYRRS